MFVVATEASMGDKSPKSKQREKKQKAAAQTQSKNKQAVRQAGLSASATDKKKK